MQKVRGSNLLSSTQVKGRFRTRNSLLFADTAAGQAPALALFFQAMQKYAGAARPRMESHPVNRRSTQVSVVLAPAATGGVVAATGLIDQEDRAGYRASPGFHRT